MMLQDMIQITEQVVIICSNVRSYKKQRIRGMKYTLKELLHINYAKVFYNKHKGNFLASIYYKSKSKKSLNRLTKGSKLIPIICLDTNDVGQLTHPDGIVASKKFRDKVMLTVSGYPFGVERDESQYVIVSDDGIHFKNVKNQMTLAEYTGKGRSHYSDGEIIEENGKIYVFYRYCNVDNPEREITILRKETDDLENWENEIIVLQKKAQTYISPAFVKVEKEYDMYFVEEQENKDMLLKRLHSSDLNFVKYQEEELVIKNSPLGMKLWHVDVVKEGNVIHGLFVYTNGKGGKEARLYYSRSMDDGFTWVTGKEIILDVDYKYVSKIYRSTMVKVGNDWNLYVPINTTDECWFLFVMPEFDFSEYE